MSFSDEDIEGLEETLAIRDVDGLQIELPTQFVRNLLHRLKSGEDFMFSDQDSYDDKLNIWRKAAGK